MESVAGSPGVTANAAPSPVADAVEKSDLATLRTLLKQRADVDAPKADGMTALHWAAHLDDLEAAKLLLRSGAAVTVTNRYGVTPLWLACANGSTGLVELLLMLDLQKLPLQMMETNQSMLDNIRVYLVL